MPPTHTHTHVACIHAHVAQTASCVFQTQTHAQVIPYAAQPRGQRVVCACVRAPRALSGTPAPSDNGTDRESSVQCLCGNPTRVRSHRSHSSENCIQAVRNEHISGRTGQLAFKGTRTHTPARTRSRRSADVRVSFKSACVCVYFLFS